MAFGKVIAGQRPPSILTPGPDGTLPWSYTRLIQPILDQKCLSCHNAEAKLPLTGRPVESFSESYNALQQYARWYEWGDKSISVIVSRPGEMPSDMSPLPGILRDDNHSKIALSDDEWRRIYLWLDANGAFYGAYSQAEQLAQQKGDAIKPPALQ
jgi:hypothetical protein